MNINHVALDRYLTTPPDDGLDSFAEAVQESYSDTLYNRMEAQGFINSDLETKWIQDSMNQGILPVPTSKEIERLFSQKYPILCRECCFFYKKFRMEEPNCQKTIAKTYINKTTGLKHTYDERAGTSYSGVGGFTHPNEKNDCHYFRKKSWIQRLWFRFRFSHLIPEGE